LRHPIPIKPDNPLLNNQTAVETSWHFHGFSGWAISET